MAKSDAEKRQGKFDRMLHQFGDKQAKHSYAHVLNICAATFQKLRVLQEANDQGVVSCITCGKLMMFNDKDSQGGHWISRHHTALLFCSRNVNVQCGYFCNGQGGKPVEYRQWLVNEYGEDAVKELEQMKRSRKYSLEELVKMRMGWMDEIRKHTKRVEQ